MKFLLLLPFFLRPKTVKNALQSIKDSPYKDWNLAFICDSPEIPGKPVVEEMFNEEELNKTKFYSTGDTAEQKRIQGQSRFGQFMNLAIKESNADIVLMVNDDDALFPSHLNHLNKYYQEHPEVFYSYGHIILFNPLEEDFNVIKHRTEASEYLKHYGPIDPFCRLDSSQVSWRRVCNIEGNCWFHEFKTSNQDACMWEQLRQKYGLCVFNGGIMSFKGWHNKRLGYTRHVNNPYGDTE